jgi:hypothetical protein
MAISHAFRSIFRNPSTILKNALWRINPSICRVPTIQLLGAPRSGTTLLKNILASHSQIRSTSSEGTGLFMFRDIFSRPSGLSSDMTELDYQCFLMSSTDIVSLYENIVRNYSDSGNSVFLDKANVIGFYNKNIYLKNIRNAKFIFMVRDPCGMVASGSSHVHLRSYSSESMAHTWNRFAVFAKQVEAVHPVHVVRYEELCNNPTKIVAELIDFLELGEEPIVNSDDRINRGLSMADTDGFDRLSEKIDVKSLLKYENILDLEEIKKIRKITSEISRYYGY